MREMRKSADGRESRFVPAAAASVASRAAGDDTPVVEGYAALFNSETVIGSWFREVILPGAFKDTVANDDIRVAFNHSPHYIIGRTSAKTAEFTEDKTGLRYKADPPDTTWAKDMVTSIKRRDITGSSFQFEVEKDEDEEWDFSQTKQGKLPLRTIKRAKLYEGGPVAFPAYEDTTVSARAIGRAEQPPAAATEVVEQPAAAVTPSEGLTTAVASLASAIAMQERHMDASRPTDPAAQQALMDEMRTALRALDPTHALGQPVTRSAPAARSTETAGSKEMSDLERELALLEQGV
jgi:uncharacterized protein